MESTAKSPRRRRRFLVGALLSAAVLIGLFAMFALWANRQALNTDNWTDTSTKLLADEDVQNAVGAYLVTQLFSEVDVAQKLRDVLPPQAAPLAGPFAGGLQQLAGRAAP